MIRLLFTFDQNYLEQFLCTFRSILATTESKIKVYIFYHDQSPEYLENLKKLETELNKLLKIQNFDLNLKLFNDSKLDSFPIKDHDHVSLATYIRLLIPKYLTNLNKILYLDSDLIVRSDLNELWKLDLGDHYIAAVDQGREDANKFYRHFYSFKDFDCTDFRIFNAGVLLINLKLWRKDNLMPKFLDFIQENHRHLRFHDQDVLNYFCQDRWYKLDPSWNHCLHLKHDDPEAIHQATIVHYTGKAKPWHSEYTDEISKEYWNEFWKGNKLEKKKKKEKKKKFVFKVRTIHYGKRKVTISKL